MNKLFINEFGNIIKDYSGLKNNFLTAIKYSKTIKKQTYWYFLCDCGNEKILRPNKVFYKKSTIKSCGCLKKNKTSEINVALKRVYNAYKKGALLRNYSFEININEFKNITSLNCFYCGIKPNKKSKTKTDEYLYNGIDRKDNCKGYVIDDCLPCCTICNKSKRDLDYLIFTKWIKRISKFQMKK